MQSYICDLKFDIVVGQWSMKTRDNRWESNYLQIHQLMKPDCIFIFYIKFMNPVSCFLSNTSLHAHGMKTHQMTESTVDNRTYCVVNL